MKQATLDGSIKKPSLKVCYVPEGRAGEYCPLALNPYLKCEHGCTYCFVPQFTHQYPETFFVRPKPRDIVQLVEHDAEILSGTKDPVFLAFLCDPYQPAEEGFNLVRGILEIFQRKDVAVRILTKAAELPRRDFSLMKEMNCELGCTLTFLENDAEKKWEPNASPNIERMKLLRDAHNYGIKTWASLEPVIYPLDTLEIIRQTHEYIDEYRVGKLNYVSPPHPINWKRFHSDVVHLLESLGKTYLIKQDLALAAIGKGD